MKRLLVVLWLACNVPAALACGYCVEDKIAGVYDHAMVKKAIDGKHLVVFFAIDGRLRPGEPMRRRIATIAQSVPGIDRDSVRVSMELGALAIAFDPRRTNLGVVQNVLERRLAAMDLSLLTLRVMDRPGDLAAVHRR